MTLPEYNGGTVLHMAAQNGAVSIIHMLLVCGLQSDVFDKDQNTPLMLAVTSDKCEAVEYLLRTGATVDLKVS